MSRSPVLLQESWQVLQTRVNAQLEQYMQLSADCPARLRDSMAYSLLAGGKRLRPVLVLLACEACGGSADDALPAACAIEMVHTYSLIHDDLPAMDDDDLRRGRPTNHIQFDEAQAILAGDGLLTLAFEVIARDISPSSVAAACCVDLASAAGPCGMVAGQVADLAAEHQPVESDTELEAVHRRKTGRLLASAVTMGARIAGADAPTLSALETYGIKIGLAFQIADDLLDVTGSREKMGKAVGKDASHGKLTYPQLLGETESRMRAEKLILEACEAISFLEERGQRLEALARFVLERDH